MVVRRFLHRKGFRYRLHAKDLPGRPDLVLPKHETVVFVHGCFWHGHRECVKGQTRPKTRPGFWNAKLEANIERDREAMEALKKAGWEVLVVWECATTNQTDLRESLRPLLEGNEENGS